MHWPHLPDHGYTAAYSLFTRNAGRRSGRTALLNHIKQAAAAGDALSHLVQDAEADSTRWVDVLQSTQQQSTHQEISLNMQQAQETSQAGNRPAGQ